MNAHANLTVEFCEGRYGGLRRLFATTPMPEAAYLPEPLSCASALFIGAVGVHLFCQWRVGSGILRLLAACFIVNGIASFAYHYSADPLWGRIDGSSMLLAVYLTIGLLMDQLLSELLDIAASSNYGDTGSAAIWKVVLRPLIRAHRRTFRHGGCAQLVCSSSIWSCALLVMLWLFFGEPPQDAFVKAFAIPLVLMLLCGTLIMLMPLSLKPDEFSGSARNGVAWSRLYPDVVLGCRIRFGLGFLIVTLSAALWLLTENLCESSEFWKLFPGHLVWHIGMPLGLMNCLSICALLQAEAHGKYPYFAGKESKQWTAWVRAVCCPMIRTEFLPRPVPELPFWPRRIAQGAHRGQELTPAGDPCLPGFMLARVYAATKLATSAQIRRSTSASADLDSLRSAAKNKATTAAGNRSKAASQATVTISVAVEPTVSNAETDGGTSGLTA